MNAGKKNVLGILIDAVDYGGAMEQIIEAAHARRAMCVAALAVHGVMTGVLDPVHKYRLNHFGLLVPDGQPVRWAVNLLYKTELPDRVYGPNLTLGLCERAAAEGLSLYFYGSTEEILCALKANLVRRFPRIRLAGLEPSRFRRISQQEKREIVERIRASGANIVFSGLGCPRQEVWAYEFHQELSVPVIAVGAAFPFLAEKVPQAPCWMQDRGLEWLFRFYTEPARLWGRYVLLNPAYLALLALQALGLRQFTTSGIAPVADICFG